MLPPTSQEHFAEKFRSLETNESCSEAVVTLHDDSRLCFIHTVEKRQALAVGPEGRESEHGAAGTLLSHVKMFRLNTKHLELWFQDESRWEIKPTPGDSMPRSTD